MQQTHEFVTWPLHRSKAPLAASHSSHMLFLMLHALPLNQHPNDGGNGLDGGDSLEFDFPFDMFSLGILLQP